MAERFPVLRLASAGRPGPAAMLPAHSPLLRSPRQRSRARCNGAPRARRRPHVHRHRTPIQRLAAVAIASVSAVRRIPGQESVGKAIFARQGVEQAGRPAHDGRHGHRVGTPRAARRRQRAWELGLAADRREGRHVRGSAEVGRIGSHTCVGWELRGGRWSERPRSTLPAPLRSVPAPAAQLQLRRPSCPSAPRNIHNLPDKHSCFQRPLPLPDSRPAM